jgi:hypothetical protein
LLDNVIYHGDVISTFQLPVWFWLMEHPLGPHRVSLNTTSTSKRSTRAFTRVPSSRNILTSHCLQQLHRPPQQRQQQQHQHQHQQQQQQQLEKLLELLRMTNRCNQQKQCWMKMCSSKMIL